MAYEELMTCKFKLARNMLLYNYKALPFTSMQIYVANDEIVFHSFPCVFYKKILFTRVLSTLNRLIFFIPYMFMIIT